MLVIKIGIEEPVPASGHVYHIKSNVIGKLKATKDRLVNLLPFLLSFSKLRCCVETQTHLSVFLTMALSWKSIN